MGDPLVSAIIPTYNNAAMAVEAVESVLAQSWPRVEVFVVDDGSTDDTAERLKRFGARITLIRQEHRGPPFARNAGIRASTGAFVAFLDSDDLWMPEKLARCLPPFENPEVGVVYTGVRIREVDSGRVYPLTQYTLNGWMARDLFLECKGVNTSTLVVRRTALDRVGLFDEELFRAQDWDLMVRLAEAWQYAHVPDLLTERRLHRRSLSVTHQALYAKYNLLVLQKALARRPDLYQAVAADAFGRAHFRFGMLQYGEYRMPEARQEFRRSLGYRWNGRVLDYYLRSWLPVPLVRALRGWKSACADSKTRRANERVKHA